MQNSQVKSLSYFMWLLATLFFSFQFILRLWPGLMMDNISLQFGISATGFGLLASVYYWGYALMQIPLAIMLDRFGPKYLLFISATICGLASILFSYADNLYIALFSRFLIGVGSAAGFLTVSKVISQWFPKNRYSQMVGFSFALGLAGAVYGGRPVNNLVETSGYFNVSIGLGVTSIIIGLLALLLLRNKGRHEGVETEAIKLTDLVTLLTSPAICLLALANLLMVGSLEGFADVWGVNYLMSAHGLEKGDAAGITSFIFIGMVFGGPVLAYIGNYFGNYKTIICCGVGMAAISCIIFYAGLEYNYYLFAFIFTFIGILCCYQVLIFSVGHDLVDARLLGIIIAFLNCVNMLGGSFFHSIIGKLMDVFWLGEFNNDGTTRLYEVINYSYALSIIPICSISGALIVWYVECKYKKVITLKK